MSQPRTAYGWEDDGHVYLSTFPAGSWPRPANRYASREEAEAFVKSRNSPGRENIKIVWEN